MLFWSRCISSISSEFFSLVWYGLLLSCRHDPELFLSFCSTGHLWGVILHQRRQIDIHSHIDDWEWCWSFLLHRKNFWDGIGFVSEDEGVCWWIIQRHNEYYQLCLQLVSRVEFCQTLCAPLQNHGLFQSLRPLRTSACGHVLIFRFCSSAFGCYSAVMWTWYWLDLQMIFEIFSCWQKVDACYLGNPRYPFSLLRYLCLG